MLWIKTLDTIPGRSEWNLTPISWYLVLVRCLRNSWQSLSHCCQRSAPSLCGAGRWPSGSGSPSRRNVRTVDRVHVVRRVCAVDIFRRYKSVTPSRLGPFGIYGSCSDVVFLDDTTMSQGDLEDKSALGGPLSTKVNRVGFLDSRTTSFLWNYDVWTY